MKRLKQRGQRSRFSLDSPSTKTGLQIFCLLLFFGSYLFFSISNKLFVISEIHCYVSDVQSCDETLNEELSLLRGKFFFNKAVQTELDEITQRRNYLSYTINKQFPSTIFVYFHSEPLVLQLDCGSENLAVTKESNIIIATRTPNLPAIHVAPDLCTSIKQAAHIDPAVLLTILDMTEYLSSHTEFNSFTWVDTHTFTLKTEGSKTIQLPTKQTLVKVKLVPDILTHSSLPAEWHQLDLRFSKAIIR